MSEPEEFEHDRKDEFFEDWKQDNLDTLRSGFIETFYFDEFAEYCREEFKKWGEK